MSTNYESVYTPYKHKLQKAIFDILFECGAYENYAKDADPKKYGYKFHAADMNLYKLYYGEDGNTRGSGILLLDSMFKYLIKAQMEEFEIINYIGKMGKRYKRWDVKNFDFRFLGCDTDDQFFSCANKAIKNYFDDVDFISDESIKIKIINSIKQNWEEKITLICDDYRNINMAEQKKFLSSEDYSGEKASGAFTIIHYDGFSIKQPFEHSKTYLEIPYFNKTDLIIGASAGYSKRSKKNSKWNFEEDIRDLKNVYIPYWQSLGKNIYISDIFPNQHQFYYLVITNKSEDIKNKLEKENMLLYEKNDYSFVKSLGEIRIEKIINEKYEEEK